MRALSVLALVACAPRGPVAADSEELGVLEQSDLIQGRDGGSSAQLWGRSYWAYGDTVLNVEDALGHNWHHNSVSWTEDTTADDLIDGFSEPLDEAGAPDYLIAPTADELAFNLAHDANNCQQEPCGARWAVWPGAPLWDDANQRAIIPYGLIYAEPGDMNFEARGYSLATWTDPGVPPDRTGALLWGEGNLPWGEAALLTETHLYLFACPRTGMAHKCALARAPLADILEPDAWQYRARDRWSDAEDDAVSLFEGAPIMSVSWNPHLGAYLLIYTPPLSDEIVARTAPEPWGPWSRASTLHRTSDEKAPYDVVHHAEFEEADGKIQYLTWSRSNGEGWFGTEFPLLRVTFE